MENREEIAESQHDEASGANEQTISEAAEATGNDRDELLRRAVFAEESLELSRYVTDDGLLKKLRTVITGSSEVELKEKLGVIKEVLAHLKEAEKEDRPTQQSLQSLVSEEVDSKLERIQNASQEVNAAVSGSRREPKQDEVSASDRLRKLARLRGIFIR